MENEHDLITINGKEYSLYYSENEFVKPENKTAFCEDLASDFLPVVLEDKDTSDYQFQPSDSVYYQIQVNKESKLCIIYVYSWPQSEPDLEFGYYKQIQMHFDLKKKILESIVVSSDGSLQDTKHHVHIFRPISSAKQEEKNVKLSSLFPFKDQKTPQITVIERPMFELSFDNVSPVVKTLSFGDSFYAVPRSDNGDTGYKKRSFSLEKLDEQALQKWYFEDAIKFGHDLYDPFESPHIFFVIPSKTKQASNQPDRKESSEKENKLSKTFGMISSKLSFKKKIN